jgi:hypothetical protein
MHSVRAAEGGYTNYVPGTYGTFAVAVRPDPGIQFSSDLYYYSAKMDQTVHHGQLRVDLDWITAELGLGFAFAPTRRFLGGQYVFELGLPIVYGRNVNNFIVGPDSKSIVSSGTAIGDLGLVPISMYWQIGSVHLSVSEAITIPVGSYDLAEDFSASLNYWSFDTSFSLTWLDDTKGNELSATVGYIFNTRNPATDYLTGQEFHLDYMLNHFFSDSFALGLHGFYYRQITGDSGSGAVLGDFKGEAAGIGPAVLWARNFGNVDLEVSAKWLHEYHAKRRLKGENIYLNIAILF